MRVRQGVDPQFFAHAVARRAVAGFAAAVIMAFVAQPIVFGVGQENHRLHGGQGGKGAGAPADVALLYGKAAQHRHVDGFAVLVVEGVVGHVVTQLIAVLGAFGKAFLVLGRTVLYPVQEEDVAGLGAARVQGDRIFIKQHNVVRALLA